MIAFDSSDKSNHAFPQGYDHSIKESHGASCLEIVTKSLGTGMRTWMRLAKGRGTSMRTSTRIEDRDWDGTRTTTEIRDKDRHGNDKDREHGQRRRQGEAGIMEG